MKKTMKLLALVMMLLALCSTAFALEQGDIEGVWDVDLHKVFVNQGYTEEDVDALLAMADMSMTVTFTKDQQFVMDTIVNGEVSRQAMAYTISGDTLRLEDGSFSTLKREGDGLTVVDPDGTTLVLSWHGEIQTETAQTAAAPQNTEVVGLWEADKASILSMSGVDLDAMTEEQRAAAEATLAQMSMTMEFTADGKAIMTMTVFGEAQVEEGDYMVQDGQIFVDGDPAQYTIEGDTMTLSYEGQFQMSMTRVNPLLGVWDLDVVSLMQLVSPELSLTEEEMEAICSLMTATMEFTADGRMLLVTKALDQTTTEENSYTLKDGKVFINGAPAEFVIEGDTLTIIENGMTMTLTRHQEAQPEA